MVLVACRLAPHCAFPFGTQVGKGLTVQEGLRVVGVSVHDSEGHFLPLTEPFVARES